MPPKDAKAKPAAKAASKPPAKAGQKKGEEEDKPPPGPPLFPVKHFEPTQICVIDNGAWQTKAGFASEIVPRTVFPTVVGAHRNKGVAVAMGGKDCYVGHACEERRGMLDVHYPIKDGCIVNWADMERLWASTIYEELRIAPDQHAFLITESALNPRDHRRARERMTELFFEGFAAEGLYLAVNSVMSLYAAGLTTGVVVDSGSDMSMAVPVHEGYALTRQITTSPVAGAAVTNYLVAQLAEKGYRFTTANELDIVTNIKETQCFVAEDYEQALEEGEAQATTYALPDGQEIRLQAERFRCGEYLFNFGLMHGETQKYTLLDEKDEQVESRVNVGLSTLLYESIYMCEPALRPRLYNNVVLAGGATMFAGTKRRLHDELLRMYREAHPTENAECAIRPDGIRESAQRAYSAWVGGSMLGMLTMFPHMLIQKQEYNEMGESVVHCKCF
eukprot:TRINITY_DN1337_c0_g3_i1.p2 TRINITY_DN1337_c0_g3~~TRINITY_DN1337_c0_g3_i1.p2  ORF type:complete len:484 (+),score=153.34 TRINITY_DN1337_c0_g3_i1:114-1454(+)